MRKAISVTISDDNLLWLRGQAGRSPRGSVSEVIDRIVAEARRSGRTDPAAVRSIVATIDLPDDDPKEPPKELMIQFNFNGEWRRACWGARWTVRRR